MYVSIKEQIEKELCKLIGKKIKGFGRAALMLIANYGEIPNPSEAECKEKDISSKLYAIHAHSSWRLLKDDDIILAQSEMFNRVIDGCFKIYEYEDEEAQNNVPFIKISDELNAIFESEIIRVTKIEANELGDLKVFMEKGYCLEIFVDSIGNIESWRFFADGDTKHFVVFEDEEE